MTKTDQKAITRTESVKNVINQIPRGQPKSGRLWKTVRLARHSEIKKVKCFKSSWSRKMANKAEKQSVKDFQKRLQETRDKDLEEKRLRREEKMKRKEENEKKSEVVQPIKNTAKIKRMKKKQLRTLAKR